MANNLFQSEDVASQIIKYVGFSSSVSSSIASPSTAVRGVAWDNTNLYSVDDGSDKYYKHSGFTTTITDSFTKAVNYPRELDWKDSNLYGNNVINEKVYKYSGFSSTVLDSFSSPGGTTQGMTWLGSNVVTGSVDTDKVYKFSGFSSTITDSFAVTDPLGMTEDENNNLIVLLGAGVKIVKYSGFSNSVLDSFTGQGSEGRAYGLAWESEAVIVEKEVVDSGVGAENVLVNKDLVVSEAGSGAEDIKINKDLLMTDSGVGAETITVTITAAKEVSDSGAGVDDVTVTKLPALVEKHILIKVYDNEGNYLESWDDATFAGFTKEINGGLGECQIKLGRTFDNYGEYFDVKHNNEVRILITDRDTRGTDDKYILIYSGYISKYTPWIEGGREGVVVHCLGYYTKFAQDIYKNGTTTTIQETATDVGTMFRNLMDRYIAETTTPKLHYSLESITATGTTATYAFEMMTYREGIEVIKSLAPTDWWWYVDQWHKVKFKSKPTTTDHTFIFGRHFHSVKVEKSMEKIKNALLFWNRETADNKIYKLYVDATSVSDHGRRVIKHIDQGRVGATIDADKIGDAFVAEHKEPDIKVLVEIIDNAEDPYRGYDIESIEPGQTCIFSGFSEALSETFKENMLITKVEYTLEKVRLTIEPTRAGIVDRLEHVARQVSEANTKNAPASYST